MTVSQSEVDAARVAGQASGSGTPSTGERRPGRNWGAFFSVTNIGAFYVLLLECVVFSIWAPKTFPHFATVKQVLDSNPIVLLAALAILVPLSAATFDLSFAYTMSLSGVTAAHLVVSNHMPTGAAMILGVLVGAVVGLINSFVVVVLNVDSFIGTLGTSQLVNAFISYVTADKPISDLRLANSFTSVSQKLLGGVIASVWWALGVAVLLWLFMEFSSTGRRLYAAGFNPEAARLAGINVNRLRFGALMTSSLLAGFAGVMLASTISSGSPSAGQQYLLPTFAAAFVGATQFKGGRMNVWGTILAVLMIGVGTAGLGFVSTRDWPQEMFEGLALIAALAASSWATNLIATSAPWRRIVTPLKSAMPGGGRSG